MIFSVCKRTEDRRRALVIEKACHMRLPGLCEHYADICTRRCILDKASARACALEQRSRISANAHAAKSDAICEALVRILDDTLAANGNVTADPGVCYRQEPLAIALYQAMRDEASIERFAEAVFERGMTACFPCMMRPTDNASEARQTMVFRAVSRKQYEAKDVPFLVSPLRSFEPGAPELSPYPAIDASLLDMVIVPLVAFDSENNRLGYGGGNYDRLIPNLRDNATVVGVAFEEQRIDAVPCDAHDQQLPRIVSA